MNIAAFIISLIAGLISFLQGGCIGGLGSMSARLGSKGAATIAGAGGFVMIAAIVGIVGGSMALMRKEASKIVLCVSTALCLFAAMAGFSDGMVWGFLYGLSALFTHLDTKTPAADSVAEKNSVSAQVTSWSSKLFASSEPKSSTATANISTASQTPNVSNTANIPVVTAPTKVLEPLVGIETSVLVKRAFLFLEDDNFDEADRYLEQALNQDPENSRAYLGKLMVEKHVHNTDELAKLAQPLDDNKFFKRALRFANDEEKASLQAYAAASRSV